MAFVHVYRGLLRSNMILVLQAVVSCSYSAAAAYASCSFLELPLCMCIEVCMCRKNRICAFILFGGTTLICQFNRHNHLCIEYQSYGAVPQSITTHAYVALYGRAINFHVLFYFLAPAIGLDYSKHIFDFLKLVSFPLPPTLPLPPLSLVIPKLVFYQNVSVGPGNTPGHPNMISNIMKQTCFPSPDLFSKSIQRMAWAS